MDMRAIEERETLLIQQLRALCTPSESTRAEYGDPPTAAMIEQIIPLVVRLQAIFKDPFHIWYCYGQEVSAEWWPRRGQQLSFTCWPNQEFLAYGLGEIGVPALVDVEGRMDDPDDIEKMIAAFMPYATQP